MYVIIRLSFIALLGFLYSCNNVSTLQNKTTEPIGKLIEGRKQGEWKTYYSISGNLCKVENYAKDTLNGISLTYHDNGLLYTRAHYKMGKMVDSFICYYSNGQPNFETWRDCNGKEQGLFRLYYESGQVKQEGVNKDGQMQGLWKTFYPNGKVQALEFYKDSRKDSIWTYYNEAGKLIKTESYNHMEFH